MSVKVTFTDKEFFLVMATFKNQSIMAKLRAHALESAIPEGFDLDGGYHPNLELSRAHAAQADALDALVDRLGGGD